MGHLQTTITVGVAENLNQRRFLWFQENQIRRWHWIRWNTCENDPQILPFEGSYYKKDFQCVCNTELLPFSLEGGSSCGVKKAWKIWLFCCNGLSCDNLIESQRKFLEHLINYIVKRFLQNFWKLSPFQVGFVPWWRCIRRLLAIGGGCCLHLCGSLGY